MNKTNIYTSKTRMLAYVSLSLLFVLVAEGLYLTLFKSTSDATLLKKREFIKLSTLPDLAISTEASYIRHRTFGTVFSIYKDDGTLREYFPSSYAISHSHIINPHAKNIDK